MTRMVPVAWRDDAACRHHPQAVFFHAKHLETARAVCAGCPVIDECRSVHGGEEYGVFFGTTPKERGIVPQVLGPRVAAVCGTTGGFYRHHRNGEPPCDACRDARNEYRRSYSARQKEAS